ncbi:MAG: hypothetical protein U0641_06695 [Anaerolineae bacterium]
MSAGVYVLHSDGKLVEMREQQYDSEDLLQKLLADYPGLLAGDQIDSANPRRWLLIKREAPVGPQDDANRWSIDHLFLDQDAVPTIVEVKRSTDSRIRREVVGQMLDYASNAVAHWPVEDIRIMFERRCERLELDPVEELAAFLGEANPSEFWLKAKINLQAGRIRMLFVADVIPAELRRIVEFLNEQMDPAEVLAVEIRQFTGQGLKTLIPQVIGQTSEAQQKKSPGTPTTRQWNEASIFEKLRSEKGDEAALIARALLGWAYERGLRIFWGKGPQMGSFFVQHGPPEDAYYTFAVWTYATVEIQFQYINKPPFDDLAWRGQLLDRLNKIPGITLTTDQLTKRPGIKFAVLKNPTALQQFLDVWDWYLGEIKHSQQTMRA